MIQPVKAVDTKSEGTQNTPVNRIKDVRAGEKPADPIEENGRKLGLAENCVRVLKTRYLKKGPDGKVVETPEELFRRVAHTVASIEPTYKKPLSKKQIQEVEDQFFDMMVKGVFMPNSPTLMNAGREMGMLSACFVLPVGDSIDEIFDTVKATALIQKAGGGTGFSFDRLRPTGDFIKSSGGTTSGPISFWRVLSEATNAIQQGAFRRGANMGMMSINHPDILKFIEAKQDLTQFTNYNISVKVPDEWMAAYKQDASQPNVVTNFRTKKHFVLQKNLDIKKYQISDLMTLDDYHALPADKRPEVWSMAQIYDLIVDHAWMTGEPGVVFIDRINQANPTPHVGPMEATNPCGEQPLLPYEACNLGSVNLGCFVTQDGAGKTAYDWEGLRKSIRTSTRFLDNIIDVNKYPLPAITAMCTNNRKIGLGIMGFADALYKLGVGYNTEEGVAWGERFMKFVNDESHQYSEELAEERGCYPNWKGSIHDTKQQRKMRNSCATTVAPTGTISIIANCSGGVEPLFSLAFFRQVMRDHTGKAQQMVEVNAAFKDLAKAANFWGYAEQELFDRIAAEGSLHHIPNIPEDVKRVFVCAHDISPEWHVRMQAAFQKHFDSSISKTTNFPESAKREDVRAIYSLAFDLGCKGVTVYRDGCRKGQPMALKSSTDKEKTVAPPSPAVAVAPAAPSPAKPIKTPAILSAVRIRQNTPFGHMHVSITVDPKSDRELEVFAQLGKAGDVAMSDLEAISRMVSLFLRSGGSIEQVMDQLEGIGSHLSIPTKDGRVMSLGDALGKTISKYWQAKREFGMRAILLGEVDFEKLGNGNGNGNGHHAANLGDSQVIAVKDLSEKKTTTLAVTAPTPQAHAGASVSSATGTAIAGIAGTAGSKNLSKNAVAAESLLENYKLKCPECGSGTLKFMEGCVKCPGCGFSQC
ncbi:MAG: vitamin B12-dependent ribonucleotide reductase [Planctomycetes bacterium]|nr:vitamin B12-dependent ribonucleotide reductase [Planctomycetota bacterium]